MNADTADPRYWKTLYSGIAWVGIVLDLSLALSLIFMPHSTLTFFRVGGDPVTWPQFCGVLLGILSVFYIPPALDVDRFRLFAWLEVVPARVGTFVFCAVAVFGFGAPKAFLLGGVLDAIIGISQALVLMRLERTDIGRPSSAPFPARASRRWKTWQAPAEAEEPGSGATRWKKIYRWVSWLGIALNALFFLPLIFVPHRMLALLNVGGNPVAWPQLFGVLLGIISIFYIPAAIDPDRYRLYAWLGVIPSRAAGVVFCTIAVVFLGANDAFFLGAVLDFAIGAAQVVALARLEHAEHRDQRRRAGPSWRWWWREAAVVAVALAVLAAIGWHKLLRDFPQQLADGTIEEFFKHGSIGAEAQNGLPYWLWITLPTVFPEYLPKAGGYASLGFAWEPGAELPIGFSRKKIGFDRIGINCAVCHTGSVQVPGEPRPRYYLGAPATTVNILEYQRFLFQSAKDPRFNAGTLIPAIDRQTRLSWIDKLVYRLVLIPATRRELRRQATLWEWTQEKGRPPWGPGRIEPFNPVKVAILESVDANAKVGSTLGTSDMEPLWNLGSIPGRAFHWDGLNTDLREVVDSSALGDGATKKSIPRSDLRRLEEWLRHNPAPPFPFRDAIKYEFVARGEKVYQAECARCHAPGGEDTGKVIPASGKDGVGTDDNRAKMWTKEAAAAYNDYLDNLPWRFRNFRSTGGYVNVPLEGLWLRAPYLHNGSVPTLADLLEPPASRPTVFWRGLNDYDPAKAGFVSSGPRAEAEGFRYETSGRGNSNEGHVYGTTLSAEDKAALLQFLKTL